MSDTIALLRDKLGAAARQLRYLPRAYALVRSAAGRWTIAWLGLLVLQGLAPVIPVYLTKPLVDALTAAVRAGGDWESVAPALAIGLAMAAAILGAELLRGAAQWVGAVQARRVEDHVSALIHGKSTAVDLAFYEWPDFHDHLHRARYEARHRPVALLESCGAFIQNGITLAAMAAMVLAYGWWLSAALIASTVPALFVVMRSAMREHRWRTRATPDERRAAYHDWLMTSAETAAEVRLFGLGASLMPAYQALRARLRGEELGLAATQVRAELAATAFAVALAGACLGWVLWQAALGRVGLGDAALFYVAFSQGQRLLRSLLGGVGRIYHNVLFLGNLFAFLDLESRVTDPAHPRPAPQVAAGARGIALRFDHVTFTYPGSERPALRGLDLELHPGEVAALVGTNGAGKSTIVKLACRFYDPDSGAILLGGEDLRALALEEVRSRATVLFQEPVRYDATVAENIAVGPGAAAVSIAEVKAAARAAGAEELIARLPRGYETLLGRWFEGGVELSVGEWQRLALARAFLRPAPLMLLDEPTSAMDSWAELDWMARFRTLAAGRTAVIVTHRFTTAMQADVIHVMEGGRVVESGTHAQLVARHGAYARSWKAQMRAEAVG